MQGQFLSQFLSRVYWRVWLARSGFALAAIALWVPGISANASPWTKRPNLPKASSPIWKTIPANNASTPRWQDAGHQPLTAPSQGWTSSPFVSPSLGPSLGPSNLPEAEKAVVPESNAIATTYFNHQTPLPLGPSSYRDGKRDGMSQDPVSSRPLSTLSQDDISQDDISLPNPSNTSPTIPHPTPPNNESGVQDSPFPTLPPSESLESPSPSSPEKPSSEPSSAAQSPLTPLQLPPTQLINLETANVLPAGSILTTLGAHIFPKDQTGAGTGLQTYNISIEGGITDHFQLGLAWVLFDDTLGQSFQGGIPDLGIMTFAPKFKYQFLRDKNFSLAVAGSLEIGKFTGSYGLYTPNSLQQTTTTVGGTVQLPFTYNISSILQWHLVPGAVFWPNTINNGGDFYGTSFNLGTGFNFTPINRLTLFADVNLPLSGGNAVNNQGQVFQKTVWATGLTYLHSPTVGVDLYATNALGATPATQTLAFIPNGNQVAAGINLRYSPDLGQKYPTSFRQTSSPLSIRDKQLLLNGITITSAETLPTGTASLQGGTGSGINFQLSYGMSDDAQISLVGQQLADNMTSVGNDFKLGAYSKLRFLSQSNGDPFSFSLAGGIEEGTSKTAVGLFVTELAFLYQATPQFAVMFNPKAGFFGGNSIVGAGFGLNYELFKGIQVIGEVTPILTGETKNTVWAGGLRYFNSDWNAGVDIYGTNGVGTYGIGGLIGQSDNQVSVGFNLLWLWGGKSNPVAKAPSSTSNSKKLSLEHLDSALISPESASSKTLSKNLSFVSEAMPLASDTVEPAKPSEPEEQPEPEKPSEPINIPKAGNIYINLSPVSWHLDDIKSKVNDFPLGIGASYDFSVMGEDYGFLKGTIASAEFSIFRDSDFGYPAGFVGVTFRKNIVNELQIGLGTGLIYTTQLESLSGSPILPFAFPYVQTDFDFPLNLRILYIPSVSDFKSQQMFFTLFTQVN